MSRLTRWVVGIFILLLLGTGLHAIEHRLEEIEHNHECSLCHVFQDDSQQLSPAVAERSIVDLPFVRVRLAPPQRGIISRDTSQASRAPPELS